MHCVEVLEVVGVGPACLETNLHSISITMRYADYLQVENPTLGAFTA